MVAPRKVNLEELAEMLNKRFTLREMGDHFGVSPSSILDNRNSFLYRRWNGECYKWAVKSESNLHWTGEEMALYKMSDDSQKILTGAWV